MNPFCNSLFNTSLLVLISNFWVLSVSAAEYNLSDLSWLSGHWVQNIKPNRTIEVIWSPVKGDSMVGSWRHVKEGQLMGYEMLSMIEDENKNIIYRFDLFRRSKQFQDSESTHFKLLKAEPGRAEFVDITDDRWHLIMEITEEGRLKGYQVDMKSEEQKSYVGYDAVKLNTLKPSP